MAAMMVRQTMSPLSLKKFSTAPETVARSEQQRDRVKSAI